uniref:Uncharacterized LOC100176702 n=1 Tax=Ciona intestinalis TaxID=7719 RepID=H2XJP6_CIOIN|nr:uncharacterized protein LOC100176702 [Ciona intestinalis]|eukprot:XP_002128198.1 uncharacterized protein LOC100176702 [Ciona intestinalis]
MTSEDDRTMDTRAVVDVVTKAFDTTLYQFSNCNPVSDKVVTSQERNELLRFQKRDNFSKRSDSEYKPSAIPTKEIIGKMTKDVLKDKIEASSPICIPTLKVHRVEEIHEDTEFQQSTSLGGSVGDSVYDSPTLPRPSNDFKHVMIKLRHTSDIQRIRSCENVGVHESSDGESCASSVDLSSSLPHTTSVVRKRRTVRFDEATITVAAELGESAARFRSRCRKKRNNNASCAARFGESRNISVLHDESLSPKNSPQLSRSSPDSGKSIFDVCNYSPYGRYT